MDVDLRGFAEELPGGRWYMHCVDLCVDAEGASYAEARQKLDDAIAMHLEWALEEAQTPAQLLRPSPREFMWRYRKAWVRERLRQIRALAFRRGDGPAAAHKAEFVTHPHVSRA